MCSATVNRRWKQANGTWEGIDEGGEGWWGRIDHTCDDILLSDVVVIGRRIKRHRACCGLSPRLPQVADEGLNLRQWLICMGFGLGVLPWQFVINGVKGLLSEGAGGGGTRGRRRAIDRSIDRSLPSLLHAFGSYAVAS